MSLLTNIGRVIALGALFCAHTAHAVSLENSVLNLSSFNVDGTEHSLNVWSLPNDDKNNGPLSIVAVVSNSPRPGFKIIDVHKEGRIYELLEQLECESAVALSNGGFYLEDDAGNPLPMGLAISSGREINPFRPRKFGGFAVLNDDGPAIISVRNKSVAEDAQEAIQSSPIVVFGGENDMNSDDGVKFNRTAVGITTDKRVVLLGAFRTRGSAISLYEFAEAIVLMGEHGGPSIDAALALDGGPSSQIIVPATGDVFGYDGPNYLPNAVCLNIRH